MVSAFDDILGHGAVVSLLAAEASSPAQAYLFVGPASVGKAAVARRFASAILCEDDGCTRRVLTATHPDLVLVEPDGRTALTVDQARATVARSVLAPVEADRKVLLLEEAGLMNDEAANALLKTLEEPTATTVFILVAESEDDLPATVASRSRTVVFGRVPEAELAASLQSLGIEPDQAERAASAAGGRPGLALMLATRPDVAEFRAGWLGVPGRLTAAPGDAFRLAEELVSSTEPLLDALDERHAAQLEGAGEGEVNRTVKERQERERKRAATALHVTGLEMLASWYRDAAAAQLGAAVRNRDIPAAELTTVVPADAVERAGRVLATIESLQANQRPELALAALFADLGTPA